MSAAGSVLITVFSSTSSVFSTVISPTLNPSASSRSRASSRDETDDSGNRNELGIGVEVHLHGLLREDQRAGDRVGAMDETDRNEGVLLGEHLVADAQRVEIGGHVGEQLWRVGVVGEDELCRFTLAFLVAQGLEEQHPPITSTMSARNAPIADQPVFDELVS